MDNGDRGLEVTENEGLSTKTGFLEKIVASTLGASLAGAAVFASADLAQFEPVYWNYVVDGTVAAGIGATTTIGGLAGYKFAGLPRKVWNGVKKFFTLDDVGDEEEKKKIRKTMAVGCGIVATAFGGLGACILSGTIPTPDHLKPVVKKAKELPTTLRHVSTRREYTLARNLHFLQHYVFSTPLGDVPIPPTSLKNAAEFWRWHNKKLPLDSDYLESKRGKWRLINGERPDELNQLAFEFTGYRKGTIGPWIDRHIPVFNGKMYGMAKQDMFLWPLLAKTLGIPSSDVNALGLQLKSVNGKNYLIEARGLDTHYSSRRPSKLIIKEFGSNTPLFGTPILGIEPSQWYFSAGENGEPTLLYTKNIKSSTTLYDFLIAEDGSELDRTIHVERKGW